ncbi:MAG: hypothetical protein JWP17_2690 [Solirubrobacterales bacterium]|jgi:lysyl-tRNA synthetase class 2|nr:hypothetical protein [Solirubrobacterales bacterium]
MDWVPGATVRADRPLHAGRIVPAIAGSLTFVVGLVNVMAAVTPQPSGGGGVLRHAHRVPGVVAAQNLELPLGLALLVGAVYLSRRRRGALWTIVGLLVVVGAIDSLNGLDVDDTVTWALAAALVVTRDAFCVRAEPDAMPRTARLAAMTALAAVAAGWLLLALASPWTAVPLGGGHGELRDDLGLLFLLGAPAHYRGPASPAPYVLGAIGVVAFLRIAWLVCRRPGPPVSPVPIEDVARIVRSYGTDTLSAFKLRTDLDHLRSPCGEALLSYRVIAGVLLVAGDPVGPPETFPALLAAARERAGSLGLRLGVIGAGDELAAHARAAGMRSIYIGDEAIVDTASFTLEGRRIRKVRQSVRRAQRNGYTVELAAHSSLSDPELAELEALCVRARDGAPERGFSMALESLRGEHLGSSWLVVARDREGVARGLLHFTPTHGRAAASLGFMRRDLCTPNGLTDFLVVRAIELLGERGVGELSLNFAAFGRYLREPGSRAERLAGRVVSHGDRFLQLESLYRFNRKFGPRWIPRHLVYESFLALPRTGIAAMQAEGQLAAMIGR